MKPIILLLSLILNITAYAQNPKVCMVYEHLYRFGKPAKNGTLIEEYYYDKNKNIIKIQYFSSVKLGGNYETFKYNEKGQKVQKTLKTKRGRVLQTTKYTYHDSGLLLTEKRYSPKGILLKKVVYAFPEGKNYWTERKTFNSQGLESRTVNTEFSADGLRLAGVVYTASGDVKYKFKIKDHDKFGNEGSKIFFDADGKYLYTYKREWNNDNLITLKYLENKHKSRFYYENKLLIRKIIYDLKTDEPMKLIRYKYIY